MLDEELLLSLPTEDDLPDSDGKPVDNELQVLAPILLRSILAYIWADRFDWFFGVNMGIYPDPYEKAIGPDGFLSLGVPRIRDANKLRLSYVVCHEKVMPQLVLEVVSKKPGKEYSEKFRRYAEMGVLYYVIYNPTHYRRDKHEIFEVYKLDSQGTYIRQKGNPVWLPELDLGIGIEFGFQEGIQRDWIYWYDEFGKRYLAPENALREERVMRGKEQILREREQLIRRSLEEQIDQERRQIDQERRSIALNLFQRNMPIETISEVMGLDPEQLKFLQEE